MNASYTYAKLWSVLVVWREKRKCTAATSETDQDDLDEIRPDGGTQLLRMQSTGTTELRIRERRGAVVSVVASPSN
jgi:hypothetical protein